MSEPFLGQISIIGFNFAPRGWAFCDGQLLPISQNQSLYSLLGTTYGGDARTTFALPDLRGRVALHDGGEPGPGLTPRPLGGTGGEETHLLTAGEIPAHTHTVAASDLPAQEDDPVGNVWANNGSNGFANSTDGVMHTSAVTNAGGGQAHGNMQPFLTVHYIIAISGLFPSRN